MNNLNTYNQTITTTYYMYYYCQLREEKLDLERAAKLRAAKADSKLAALEDPPKAPANDEKNVNKSNDNDNNDDNNDSNDSSDANNNTVAVNTNNVKTDNNAQITDRPLPIMQDL